jgi:prophage tail gpP-like protein
VDSREPDEVSVVIAGAEFRFWTSATIMTAIDQFSTVRLVAPFEAERYEFRETFRPFTFKTFDTLIGGDKAFTGILVDVMPSVEPDSSTVEVTAYAKPAALVDCTMPGASVPLEFKGVGLRAITAAVLSPFGLEGPVFECGAAEGTRFKKEALEVDEKIHSFLVKLAQQRGLIINDTTAGALRYWRSVSTGTPVAHFKIGEQPLVKIAASFSPQEFYSEITGFSEGKRGKPDGGRYRVPNPWLADIVRPCSFKLADTDPGDLPAATKAKAGRMFGAMAGFVLQDIPTWRDPQGDLWRHNTTVTVTAPKVMIYRPTEMLVRGVELSVEKEKRTAALELVLPGSFSGEIPERLPWME